jgi:hypothetical protein
MRRKVNACAHYEHASLTDNYYIQLNPRPTQPLYLVAFRAIHLYLWEYSDLEDLGFIEKGNGGIVRINADTTYWKWRPYDGSAKGTFVDGSLPSIRK